MANQPGPLDRFRDFFLHAAVNNPLGAEAIARARYKAKGYTDAQINNAIAQLNKEHDTKYKNAPVFNVRSGHPLDYVSPSNIGRGAVSLLGSLLGGVDPTYAVGGFGKNVVRRVASQAAVQGAADEGRQQIQINTGQRKTRDHKEAAKAAAMGAVFQGGLEGLRYARSAMAPKPKTPGTDIVPSEGPAFSGEGAPEGVFPSPKAAAMHMRQSGKTQATHDIVAHGDGSYSVVPKFKAPEVINDEDLKGNITLPEIKDSDLVPVETPKAPVAQDGLPGNGSVAPLDPRVIARIMGDRDAAGMNGINDNTPDQDLANLPPANREWLQQQRSQHPYLTPSEQAEMEGMPPVPGTTPGPDPIADKPVVDNTGYERHTPYIDRPATPANDGNDSPYMDPRDLQLQGDDLADASKFLTQKGTDPKLISELLHEPLDIGIPKELYDNLQHFGSRQLEDIMSDLADGKPFNLQKEMVLKDNYIANDDEDAIAVARKRTLNSSVPDARPSQPPALPQNDNYSHSTAIRTLDEAGKAFDRGDITVEQYERILDRIGKQGLNAFEGETNTGTDIVQDNKPDGGEPEDPNAPQYDEIIKGVPGVNLKRLTNLMGPQMYDMENLPAISIKEVLQNSFDAIKDAMHVHGQDEGKIDITTDPETRTITMTDNGIGMKPETLGGKFLQIAGTGKEGTRSSGGFGIAKMQFLYGNQDIHVVTMRDGKVAEMRTRGPDLMEALDNPAFQPDIHVREPTEADHEMFPAGHGTHISLSVPKEYEHPSTGEIHQINFPDYAHNVPAVTNSPLFAPVDVTWNGGPVWNVGKEFPAERHIPFTHVKFGWGSADVYVTQKPEDNWGENVHYLSNGLWQFSSTMKKDPLSMGGKNLPHVFHIDIHPRVKPEEPGYPFALNRQSLSEGAKNDLKQVIQYINKLYAHKSLADDSKSFGSLEYIDPETGERSKSMDLRPTLKERSQGFRGIQEGDKVTVKDGRMFVNGKELPPLTPEELKDSVPSTDELKIDPKLIDPNKIMVHNNATVDLHKKVTNWGSKAPVREEDKMPGADKFPEAMPLDKYMEQKFGPRFNDLLKDVGNIFMEMRSKIVEISEDYNDLAKEGIGISLDPKYRGVSIRLPFSGSFINPLVPEAPNSQPMLQAYGILQTMIHEFAHFNVRSHNAEFPAEMQRITANLLASPLHDFATWQNEAATKIAQYKDIIAHGKDLFDKGHVEVTSERFKDGLYDTGPEGGDEGDPQDLAQSRQGSGGPEGVSGDAGEEYPTIEPRRGTSNNPESASQKAVIQRLTDILEQGKPLRRENSLKISAERAERMKKVYAARATTGGRAGLYKELAALKGEMSKARIQPIHQYFTPEEVDGLFDFVKNHPKLQGYESVRAQIALNKLFGDDYGEIPTEGELQTLAKVFPKSLIKALLDDEAGSVDINHFSTAVANIGGLPRTLKSSFDFSAPFRQGLFLASKGAFYKALPGMFKAFFSQKAFDKIQEEIVNRPTYDLMQKAGLSTTKTNGGLLDREEAFISQFAEKIPGVRHSERAYIAFLNKLRADVFDNFVELGDQAGIDWINDPHFLKSAAKFINSATGRGDLGALGRDAQTLGNIFFSPKLAASRINLTNLAFYAKLHPKVRLEAAKTGLCTAAMIGTVMGLAALGGAKVALDMRSVDFAKVRIGNTRFDVTGGFAQYLRFYAQMVTGQTKNEDGKVTNVGYSPTQKIWKGEDQGPYKPNTRRDVFYKFMENKLQPVTGEAMNLMRGTDPVGQPLTPESEAKNLFMPLIAQDTWDAYNDLGAKGILTAVPNSLGVGIQTYKQKEKKASGRPSTKDFGGDLASDFDKFGDDF